MKKDNVFIIAEISANHGNDIELVKKTIDAAKEIGCDAVKIQTYRPDTITLDCDNEFFRIDTGTIWDGTTLYQLYEEATLPWEWHEELFSYAAKVGIMLFSTPFDASAVDLLENCGNPIYKIASFEITDIPLIEYAASKHKPIIISAGIGTKEEIGDAVEACRRMGNDEVYLLKCTSQYPAELEDGNLLTMVDMQARFGVEVGLSDHSLGFTMAASAVALGAKIVEKHFILDKNIGGPDASFSMEPMEFAQMITILRDVEKTRGTVNYEVTEKKKASRKYARSLFVVKDVKAGEPVTNDNVKSIRPSAGMPPKNLSDVLGKHFCIDVAKGTPLKKELID
ncbi:MAG: pseudaminic acid synthase [Clostridiales Family XIII bacterium]|nr:pseudaminic acid synthase [Clostridia bacterium]MDE8733870.1 pseudaminic acid synthase [Eubacteriales bacterium DFI.9.88]MDY3011056.1 pseudaminic acid synthase [Clostridiales Family XIII bacterium]